MLGALLRLVVVVVVLAAVALFFTGYWSADRARDDGAVATTGEREPIDTDAARERGAAVGEAVAEGANKAGSAAAQAADRAGELLSDAGLTAKIKSKIALDDTVKALDIDVDTVDGVVTLSGRVGSEAEKQRALQLARETRGVRSVNDRLAVR